MKAGYNGLTEQE